MQEVINMNIGNSVVYFWLLPVAFQIVLPLAMLCGWMVLRLATTLFGSKAPRSNVEPVCATLN
jgi:hypothetical protein